MTPWVGKASNVKTPLFLQGYRISANKIEGAIPLPSPPRKGRVPGRYMRRKYCPTLDAAPPP
jgi:hypothetical protein